MHATHRSRVSAPWLVVALAAIGVMALAVGIVHFAPASCPRALAGERRAALADTAVTAVTAGPMAAGGAGPADSPATGEAVFYAPASGRGKCSIAPLDSDGLYASLPRSRYRDGTLCGAYLDITGPDGTVRAEIVDMCPGCSDSQLDLSTAAFARIQIPSRGTARVGWQLVRDPALPGPLAVRVGPGSTATLLALQVLNQGNPLAGVSVNGRALSPRGDGYWIGIGAGPGPFQVQVSDSVGNTATLTGIALNPGALQQTAVAMYGSATPGPRPAPMPAPPPSPPTSASTASSGVAARATVTSTGC